jgi:release factor glutamine methyltransferase
MVESALRIFRPNSKCKILEVGCGSGAISIALAHERPAQKYWVSDISIPTLRIAQENMKRHVAGRSLFTWAGDWFKPIRKIGVFDLIISNPPYIKTKEIETLSVEIKNHEPHIALDGGPDGLRAIEKLIAEAPDYIAPGGYLMLEIGFDQGHCVKKIAKATEKYERIDVKKDYSGLDRVMILKKKAC